jgi:predicted CopG family antitoxin
MKTLNISISDLEYNQFGIKKDKLSFSEFVDIVNKEVTKQALNKSVQLAERYKLSKMTMDEISDEVKAVRNAKSNH